ncbi:TIM barrel protein [Candidatus Poribacteria bacterium]|nr:TIM barrel protein [Candidatus Poribacteria bacterium]
MAKPKIACQLIIFGPRNKDDLPGVLKAVADAGYAGIEGGSSADPKELQKTLGDLNLELAGIHSGYSSFDDLDDTIAFMKSIDCKLLMCSGVGDMSRGLAAYEDAAKVFNEVGKKCHDEGIKFCYHNHSWEFKKFDGVVALEHLYKLTDPKYVYTCVDVYWVHHGGEDPVEFLTKNLDRVGTVHFKDMKDDTFAEVGEGVINFPGIMKVLEQKDDLEWIIVEQDRTNKTPEESINISRKYIKEKLGL